MDMFIIPQLLEEVGPINAAAKKMAGQMGTDDPREVFNRINSGEWVVMKAEKPVTVKLGICETPEAYRKALRLPSVSIGGWGDDILGRITCSKEKIDLELIMPSVADLGFKAGGRYVNICARAQELGYELCPAEIGPALRLQYGNQPIGERLRIAMEAIPDRDGNPRIFCVERDDDDSWLNGDYGHPDHFCFAGRRFVFCRRK